ncbi:Di-heme cytochrome, transmembrane [Melia azedarach]|uniref:Di-heme cytochrome, transmembrane n=1 Tax=Melia azedarach TaxID=155640 RepID=A0ACC1X243_MELAZ|nr:Di-heme cytochrome, transmembrane [Melia azedarach]
MAVVTVSATATPCLKNPSSLLATSSFPISSSTSCRTSTGFLPCALSATRKRRGLLHQSFALKNEFLEATDSDGAELLEEIEQPGETLLYSISPLPLLFVGALPGAGTVRSLFGPFVELVKSWNLPDWLVHWGHPGNMAVVLFAMGGYGTYLGFRIRYSDDVEEKANAKDLHPKLLGGMFFFFALGATGGITSLLTSDKPIFESPHAVTGFIGLALLTIQTILPALFEDNPGLRNVHGILGSGIMTLFLIHAALGLQLGLSY